MTSLPPSILLSGYYGYGNVGDDAILLALARELRAGGVERIVVPAGDQTGAFAGEGLEFVRRFDLRAIRAALQDGARVVSGGGGLFQDTTSVRSLVYYLGVLQLARQAGRRYVICGQSIGPLERAFSRFAVSRALAGAAAVSVRDRRSRQAVAALGYPFEQVLLTSDPAFALEPPSVERADRLALCLRPTRHRAALVEALRRWWPARPAGAEMLLLASQHGDEEVLAAVAEGQTAELVPPEWVTATMARVAGCRLVIAERLHPLIFAILSGTPCVAIDYDPKVRGLAEDFEIPIAGTDEALDPERLAALAAASWEGWEAESARLRGLAREVRQRVRGELRTVFEALA